MTRRRKQTCLTRPDGALVHRTHPIFDGDGRHIGATCQCGRVLTTPTGGQSAPTRTLGKFVRIVDSKAHRERVTHSRRARKRARKVGRR